MLLNVFYCSAENTLCVFKVLSIHLAIPRHATDKYVLFIACGASKFQIYEVLFYFPCAKDLSHYPPCFERRSDLFNITCWYMKLLHDIPKTYLLAMSIDCI